MVSQPMTSSSTQPLAALPASLQNTITDLSLLGSLSKFSHHIFLSSTHLATMYSQPSSKNTPETSANYWDPGHAGATLRMDRKTHDKPFNYKQVRALFGHPSDCDADWSCRRRGMKTSLPSRRRGRSGPARTPLRRRRTRRPFLQRLRRCART
jgi:hypothetical protein